MGSCAWGLVYNGPACTMYQLSLARSLVSTQQLYSTHQTQRVVWQEQIDRVKKAEEELRLKSLSAVKTYSTFSPEVEKKQLTEEEKPSTTLKLKEASHKDFGTKPVLTYQKTKSKYIQEAERFLKEFKQKKLSNNYKPATQRAPPPVFKSSSYQSAISRNNKGKSRYILEAERILENLNKGKNYSQTRLPLRLKQNKEEKDKKELSSPDKKQDSLDQNEIKDVLLESVNTKEGLKAIIKAFFQQAIKKT